MDAAVWGMAGTLVGALSSIATTWLAGWHSFRLQQLDASSSQKETMRAFQRTTLVELQDSLHDEMRLCFLMYREDIESFKASGSWGQPKLMAETDEAARVARRRSVILTERVANDELRNELRAFGNLLTDVHIAKTQHDATASLEQSHRLGTKLHERLGEVLRSLY